MLELHGVSFEWNKFSGHNQGERQMGMIAQEVEQVVPEWVNTDSDGYKGLSYKGFEALTVESFRELKQENELLRAELAEIKSMLKNGGVASTQTGSNENENAKDESISGGEGDGYGWSCGVASGGNSLPFAFCILFGALFAMILGRKAKK